MSPYTHKFSPSFLRWATEKYAAERKFIYVPERFTGKGGEPGRDVRPGGKYVSPPPYLAKYDLSEYVPGGHYLDVVTGERLTGRSYNRTIIDVSGGRPDTTVDDTDPLVDSPEGRTIKINLIKNRMGSPPQWKWLSDPHPGLVDTIISAVDGNGGEHYYGVKVDIPQLKSTLTTDPNSQEPRGKVKAKGKLQLGTKIGVIYINSSKKIHPLYDVLTIVPQTLKKDPEALLTRSQKKKLAPAPDDSMMSDVPKQAARQMKLSDSKFVKRSMEERTVVKERERFHSNDASALRGIFDKQHREARMMFPEASGSYEAVSFHDPDNGLRRYGYVIGEGQEGTARVELGDGEYMDVPHEELRRLGGERASSHLRMQLRAAFGGVSTDTNGLRADMHDRFAPLAVDPSNSIELLSVGYSSSVGMPTNKEIGSYVAHFHPTARLLDVDDSMPGLLGLSVQRVAEHEVEAEMGPAAGGEVTAIFDPEDEDDYEAGMDVEAEEDDLEDACWDGYKAVGLKKGKGGKMVPNCVPEKSGASEGNVGPKGRPATRMSDAALADMHKVAPPRGGQVRQAQAFKNILRGIKDVVNKTNTKQRGYPAGSTAGEAYATMAKALLDGRMDEQAAYILRKYFESGGGRAGAKFLQNTNIEERAKLALLSAALHNYEQIDRRGYEALASKLLPGFQGQDQSGQGAAGGLDQKRKQQLREEHSAVTDQFIEGIKVEVQSAMQAPGGINAYKLAELSRNIKQQLDAAVGSKTENYGWDEADIYKQVQQTFAELRGQAGKTQSRADYDQDVIDTLESIAQGSIDANQRMPDLQRVKSQLTNTLQLGPNESLEQYGWSDQRLDREFKRTFAEVYKAKMNTLMPMIENELGQLMGALMSGAANINTPAVQAKFKKYKLQSTTDPQQAVYEIQRLMSNPNELLKRFLQP